MKKNYEINSATIAIIPTGTKMSQVIELEDSFLVNQSSAKIINESCKSFGSSYEGRHEGTKHLIGVSYKSPIIIEETRELIFFPTSSPENKDCIWLSLKHIENYTNKGFNTFVTFKNGNYLELGISYESLENQILRATRLEAILRKKKML